MSETSDLIRAFRSATPEERQRLETLYRQNLAQRPNETGWQFMLRRATSPGSLQGGAVLQTLQDYSLWSQPLAETLRSVNQSPRSRQERTERRTPQAQTERLRQSVAANAPVDPARAPAFNINPQPAAAAPSTPSGARGSELATQFLMAQWPNAVRTGGDRTPERNAEVNGSPTSHHLRGNAIDVRPIPGVTFEQFVQRYRDAGFNILEAKDETRQTQGTGPHWHIAVAPTRGTEVREASRGLYTAPDPGTLAGMIPNPVLRSMVSLPDAPQMAMPEARPEYEVPDANALLAAMREASQVPQRDRSNDNWERIQSLLSGAAAGAAGLGPNATIGQILLAAGAGAGRGFAAEREDQRSQDKETERFQQQLNLALARMGVDIDLGALDVRNQNRDRAWTSSEDRRTTAFANDSSKFENIVREILLNSDIQGQNVGSVNQANMARAQALIAGTQGQHDAANRGVADMLALEGRAPQNPERQIQSYLAQNGIPETNETVAAATAIRGGNIRGALPYFAREVLGSGVYSQYLSQEEASQVQKYLQQENEAGALAIVQNALGQDASAPAGTPGNGDFAKLVQLLAGQGNPVATLLNGNVQ